MDAYWAKDIQELFRLERRSSFLRFVELILAASGGIFEATRFARPCEVSRTTIANYLAVLEATYVAHVVRPFSTHRATEIVAAPKVFAFDTGFVCYYKGWSELRSEDIGILWEHFVLNEFHARLQSRRIHYWRDKQGHEVDFVIPLRSHGQTLIECKSTIDHFDPASVRAFRAHYPDGPTYVVSPAVSRDFTKNYGSLKIRFVSLQSLIDELQGQKLLR